MSLKAEISDLIIAGKVLIALVLLIFFALIQKYVRLRLYLNSLKTPNSVVYFSFPLGILKQFIVSARKGDPLFWTKQLINANPNLRFIASHFGTSSRLMLIDPDLIKDFLTNQSRYVKAEKLFGPFTEVLGKGLLMSHGDVWKRHRKIISEVLRYDFLESQMPAIYSTSLKIFQRELKASVNEKVDILTLYQRITGELVFKVFFDANLDSLRIKGQNPSDHLARLGALMTANSRSIENTIFGMNGIRLRLFKRNRDLFEYASNFDEFCLNVVQDCRKRYDEASQQQQHSPLSKNLLNALFEYQNKTKGTEAELTDEEIVHEFSTFYLAGMDTTGHLLLMATYYFTQQDSQTKELILKEAKSIFDAGDNVSSELLHKCNIIHALLKETLRIASPVGGVFPRQALHDHYIQDLRVRKGDEVTCLFMANNLNHKNFRTPEIFNLYRWIQGHPDYEAQISKNPFVFTPFSAGPRNCIGQHLSLIEAKIVLSMFLAKYEFSIPEDYELKFKFGFVYEPKETLLITVRHS